MKVTIRLPLAPTVRVMERVTPFRAMVTDEPGPKPARETVVVVPIEIDTVLPLTTTTTPDGNVVLVVVVLVGGVVVVVVVGAVVVEVVVGGTVTTICSVPEPVVVPPEAQAAPATSPPVIRTTMLKARQNWARRTPGWCTAFPP